MLTKQGRAKHMDLYTGLSLVHITTPLLKAVIWYNLSLLLIGPFGMTNSDIWIRKLLNLRKFIWKFHLQKRPFRHGLNTLRPKQDGRRFADDTFKRIFLNENVRISIKISMTFVPKGVNNNIPALVQIMAWRRSGDKPLSEPMMVSLPTHICVTRPQWVNVLKLIESMAGYIK